MKRALPTLLVAALFLAKSAAQSDCDGQRYIDEVFSATTKSTVTFGTNLNSAGLPVTLKMDIYQPTGDGWGERPVLVLAHGGSFITGARGDMADHCIAFAKRGYVAATIDYRLWSFLAGGFPDSLDIMDVVVKAVGDMRAAVRYFREDAAGPNLYKIDPDRILVGGYSAGAVAANHMAQMTPDDAIPAFIQKAIDDNGGWTGNTGSASNLAQSADVRAVVNMSGGLYKPGWITPTDKPFISLHGQKDDVVFYNFGVAAGIMSLNGSGNLHPAADVAGLPNYLHTVPTGGHLDLYSDAAFQSDRDIFMLNGCTFLKQNVLCLPLDSDGSQQVPDDGKFHAYPNPSSDEVRVDFPDNGPRTVEVSDVAGRVVFSQKNVANRLTFNKLDIGNRDGVFFVRAFSVDGTARVGRVVFQ